MTEDGIKALSLIPSREVLLARLVGSINSPIAKMVYLLDAIAKKNEEASA